MIRHERPGPHRIPAGRSTGPGVSRTLSPEGRALPILSLQRAAGNRAFSELVAQRAGRRGAVVSMNLTPEISTAWLTLAVGTPKAFTKYKAVFEATRAYEAAGANAKKKGDALFAILDATVAWFYNEANRTGSAEKDARGRHLSALQLAVRLAIAADTTLAARWGAAKAARKGGGTDTSKHFAADTKRLAMTVSDMRTSPNLLLKNAGTYFSAPGGGLQHVAIDGGLSGNAIATGDNVRVNPSTTLDRTLLLGVLAHEYGHVLASQSGMAVGQKYEDEFHGYWKEYDIVKGVAAPSAYQARADEIHAFLVGQNQAWVPPVERRLTGPTWANTSNYPKMAALIGLSRSVAMDKRDSTTPVTRLNAQRKVRLASFLEVVAGLEPGERAAVLGSVQRRHPQWLIEESFTGEEWGRIITALQAGMPPAPVGSRPPDGGISPELVHG